MLQEHVGQSHRHEKSKEMLQEMLYAPSCTNDQRHFGFGVCYKPNSVFELFVVAHEEKKLL